MKQISTALVKAQKNFAPALKASLNPHFKAKYVDLAGCVEAVIDALNENGIFLMQASHECADGVIVETIFVHESGETMSAGKLHVPASKQDPQGYGSALTYARRYGLMAACGIAPEDDDGNAASKKPANKHAPVNAAMQGVVIPENIMEELKFLAVELVDLVESKNNPVEAYNLLERTRLSEDEFEVKGDYLLALSQIMAPNSKTRAALKKEGEARRAAHQAQVKAAQGKSPEPEDADS